MEHDRQRADAHLFVYGTLRARGAAGTLLADGIRIKEATVRGTLYNVEGRFPALVLGDLGRVDGEIWRCPTSLLTTLDRYEAVSEGLFDRVRILVDEIVCWVYVAGPALRQRLRPERIIPGGRWPPPEAEG